jgi:hypothetical protein
MKSGIKGYKASYNGRCTNNFLFEVGKTYKFDGKPILCEQGFHFCQNVDDVLDYYDYQKDFVLFEVEALGYTKTRDDKSCTNKIKIIRIVPKEEYSSIFKYWKFDWWENGELKCLQSQDRLVMFEFNENGMLSYYEEYGHAFKYDDGKGLIWERHQNVDEYEYEYVDMNMNMWI